MQCQIIIRPIFFVFVASFLMNPIFSENEKNNQIPGKEIVSEISQFPQEFYFKSPRLEKLRKIKNVIDILIREFETLNAEDRVKVLNVLAYLGEKHWDNENAKPHFAWIIDNKVIALLVGILKEKDSTVKRAATNLLFYRVRDTDMIAIGEEIIKALEESGDLTSYPKLLGKTGSARARKSLGSDPQFRIVNKESTELALAKLGDEKLEKKFIKLFLNEEDSRKKERFAINVGYVGSTNAINALAREMHSPLIVTNASGSRYSIRLPIIKALSMAMPDKDIFWIPIPEPTDDKYYIQIENYCEKNLKIKWSTPRPPFFYFSPGMHLLR